MPRQYPSHLRSKINQQLRPSPFSLFTFHLHNIFATHIYHSFQATSTRRSKDLLSTSDPLFAFRAEQKRSESSIMHINDPQPGVVRELYPWTAMCVRNVDVHVSCSSQVDAQLAAFFIDPRAK